MKNYIQLIRIYCLQIETKNQKSEAQSSAKVLLFKHAQSPFDVSCLLAQEAPSVIANFNNRAR